MSDTPDVIVTPPPQPNCPVCGRSREGLQPSEPCPTDGHRLEDAP